MTRKRWIAAVASLLIPGFSLAATTGSEPLLNQQNRPWRPTAGIEEVPLWPAGLRIAAPAYAGPEAFGDSTGKVAGRSLVVVEHVWRPTMSIYPAKGHHTGAAMLVFPGGGYRVLAIDLEGTEVCDWLTARGVTCVVLKYRVPGSGPYWNDECNCRKEPKEPMALQDAQRAMVLVRQRASSLGIDPHKIGVIGFSAGGRMVADISNHTRLSYTPVDAADTLSTRPDFAIAGYPGHLWTRPGLTLTPDIRIDHKGPPAFIIQAEDDATDDIRESLTYYLALQQAGVPVEMHLYATGGHAFGVRKTSHPITEWTGLAEQWMHTIGVL
ncbi:Acetyl esterase/lipase [Luteibacter sp. UNCMF331Sha3.1]|uniref:alpha/beta hydrolase n=1 Tax=Luteibacter sp. UNCMF331Sha3.1 TaxID=1502760 RepID=UPI0008D00940|nr:alpha/beta hydrolase [Luteibacter sp. UNCMF331Sha3.1]SEM59749.1 Acetyl esterase/lipase [Luteibacter sp. UNCMF331Sha3.1]